MRSKGASGVGANPGEPAPAPRPPRPPHRGSQKRPRDGSGACVARLLERAPAGSGISRARFHARRRRMLAPHAPSPVPLAGEWSYCKHRRSTGLDELGGSGDEVAAGIVPVERGSIRRVPCVTAAWCAPAVRRQGRIDSTPRPTPMRRPTPARTLSSERIRKPKTAQFSACDASV
jgi:hypothetical protein